MYRVRDLGDIGRRSGVEHVKVLQLPLMPFFPLPRSPLEGHTLRTAGGRATREVDDILADFLGFEQCIRFLDALFPQGQVVPHGHQSIETDHRVGEAAVAQRNRKILGKGGALRGSGARKALTKRIVPLCFLGLKPAPIRKVRNSDAVICFGAPFSS